MSKHTYEYPVHVLREDLRNSSVKLAEKLTRSVGRATSVDRLPCLEYTAEVDAQRGLARSLLRIQSARDCLERCIANGSASMRLDCERRVRMKLITPARVKIITD